MAVGAGVGFLGGLLGGSKANKEAKKELAANKQALLNQFGGMEKLTKVADSVGISMKRAFDTKKPEEFERAVKNLNVALEQQKARMDALGKAVEGVNKRAEVFAAPFRKVADRARQGQGGDGSNAASRARSPRWPKLRSAHSPSSNGSA